MKTDLRSNLKIKVKVPARKGLKMKARLSRGMQRAEQPMPRDVVFRIGHQSKTVKQVPMMLDCSDVAWYHCATDEGRRQVARAVCENALGDAADAWTCLERYENYPKSEILDDRAIEFENVRPDVCLRLPEQECQEAMNKQSPWCLWDHQRHRCSAPMYFKSPGAKEWQLASTYFGDSFNSNVMPSLDLWEAHRSANTRELLS